MIADLEKSGKSLYRQLSDICYHYKGGISWNEAWGLSFSERNTLISVLNEKLRKESGDTTEYM